MKDSLGLASSGCLISLIWLFISIPVYGLVFGQLWTWFIIPQFGVPVPPLALLLGLVLTIRFVMPRPSTNVAAKFTNVDKNVKLITKRLNLDPNETGVFEQAIIDVVYDLLLWSTTLAFGFIYHRLM